MRSCGTILLLLVIWTGLQAQDTFSIVAVDTTTGEVGSAGASCLDDQAIAGGVLIISDVLPGKGAIHTQSYWHATNQANARLRMEEGLSPAEIMAWLYDNDVQNNPEIRQYGAVDFAPDGQPRSAALTGENCFDHKGQRVGVTYAIQGNILLGPAILDSMEARFLNTSGSLAERLMAALQGANVPGADSRCLNEGVSSQSAFLRVAKPDDEEDALWLDLRVTSTPFGVEPIDSVQALFDEWLVSSWDGEITVEQLEVHPNPTRTLLYVRVPGDQPVSYRLFSANGIQLDAGQWMPGEQALDLRSFPSGVYYLRVMDEGRLYGAKVVLDP